jgi:hypothetical protein
MDADDIREMFAVSLLKTMNAGETPGTFCSPVASNVQVRMKSGFMEQKMDNRLTEHRFTSCDGGAVARDRPSRLQAEEAVRTLIYWAGDDPTREVNVRASLIGCSGSSAFRLSTTAVSMSLTGSRFSSEIGTKALVWGFFSQEV